MTVLFVIFTIILFLTVDYAVQKARTAKEEKRLLESLSQGLSAFPLRLPDGVDLAVNHTWLRAEPKGVATIGLDQFLGHMVGAVERIILPEVGAALTPASARIVLCDGAKYLKLAAPVKGKVVAVNSSILKNPALARKDPYGAGWLLKIQPANGRSGSTLLSGGKGIEWLKEQIDLAKEFLAARAPQVQYATMQDGGIPVEGMLRNCDENTWRDFQEKFTRLHPNT